MQNPIPLVNLLDFQQFVVIQTVKGFSVVYETEVDVFPGTLLLSP